MTWKSSSASARFSRGRASSAPFTGTGASSSEMSSNSNIPGTVFANDSARGSTLAGFPTVRGAGRAIHYNGAECFSVAPAAPIIRVLMNADWPDLLRAEYAAFVVAAADDPRARWCLLHGAPLHARPLRHAPDEAEMRARVGGDLAVLPTGAALSSAGYTLGGGGAGARLSARASAFGGHAVRGDAVFVRAQ